MSNKLSEREEMRAMFNRIQVGRSIWWKNGTKIKREDERSWLIALRLPSGEQVWSVPMHLDPAIDCLELEIRGWQKAANQPSS